MCQEELLHLLTYQSHKTDKKQRNLASSCEVEAITHPADGVDG